MNSEGLDQTQKIKRKFRVWASLVQMKLMVLESALKAIHQIGYKGRECETKFNKSAIDSFREKYEYLNDETLLKAAAEVPELLVKMVADSNLHPSTRGDILQAIAYGARPEYFEFVRSQIGHDSPFIREAAMLALFSYYRSNDIYSFLKGELINLLESEKAEGVRRTLEELLEEID